MGLKKGTIFVVRFEKEGHLGPWYLVLCTWSLGTYSGGNGCIGAESFLYLYFSLFLSAFMPPLEGKKHKWMLFDIFGLRLALCNSPEYKGGSFAYFAKAYA